MDVPDMIGYCRLLGSTECARIRRVGGGDECVYHRIRINTLFADHTVWEANQAMHLSGASS